MSHRCYSFEPSGHHFEPLDIVNGIVLRLFCSRCSRVVATSAEHNREGWDFESLPPEAQRDFLTNPPIVIRKES